MSSRKAVAHIEASIAAHGRTELPMRDGLREMNETIVAAAMNIALRCHASTVSLPIDAVRRSYSRVLSARPAASATAS